MCHLDQLIMSAEKRLETEREEDVADEYMVNAPLEDINTSCGMGEDLDPESRLHEESTATATGQNSEQLDIFRESPVAEEQVLSQESSGGSRRYPHINVCI